MTQGFVNSFQSLGAADGPGIRFVVFTQGCNLRCGCCHNPDTWQCATGQKFEPEDIVSKVIRYKEYFGESGGITVSGGEPLLQPLFVKELFELCHNKGINTCLDTSGSVINENVLNLLDVCDTVLLDIKYTSDEYYKKYVGCEYSKPLEFLEILQSKNIDTWLRQVTIPSLNDDEENIQQLKKIANSHSCVKKVELLPFHKICKTKYDNLGMEFPFERYDVPTKEKMDELNKLLLS